MSAPENVVVAIKAGENGARRDAWVTRSKSRTGVTQFCTVVSAPSKKGPGLQFRGCWTGADGKAKAEERMEQLATISALPRGKKKKRKAKGVTNGLV